VHNFERKLKLRIDVVYIYREEVKRDVLRELRAFKCGWVFARAPKSTSVTSNQANKMWQNVIILSSGVILWWCALWAETRLAVLTEGAARRRTHSASLSDGINAGSQRMVPRPFSFASKLDTHTLTP